MRKLIRKYETNGGVVGLTAIDADQGYQDIAGDGPAGPAQSGVYFYKSKSKRSRGIQVRFVNLSAPDGPVTPGGQQPKFYARATVLTPDDFATIQEGDAYTIGGKSFTVDSKSEEG